MIYYRTLQKALERAIKTFPAIAITGPRQSGKTTLVKMIFSQTHYYCSLEDPDVRIRARSDPKGFLSQFFGPVIFDKIQYVPELLSYIKTRIDQDRTLGQWILTGSQYFALMENISQSLAGRVAVLYLLPFSIAETAGKGSDSKSISDWLEGLQSFKEDGQHLPLEERLLKGFYPEVIANKDVDRKMWCASYITTYLERDIRNLSNVGDLNQFERFLVACAIRSGQIINLSEISKEIGISVTTAKRWLSMLEAGGQVFLLYPYFKNIGKRIVKSPKLYFIDTSICTYLLALHTPELLMQSTYFGNLFETMVICDVLKRFYNHGEKPSMYYMRTRDGLEVDLIIENDGRLYCFEIKGVKTIYPRHISSLKRIKDDLKDLVEMAALISASDESFYIADDIFNFRWDLLLMQ